MFDELPKDPFMLFSHVNMLLRDEYSSLDEVGEEKGLNREVIETVLGSAGFEYNKEQNKFW